MLKYLKIRIVSLSEESRIIRRAERKLKGYIDFLKGRRSYRHGPDDKRPVYKGYVTPDKRGLNKGGEDNRPANHEEAAARAFEEFWSLQDHRRRQVRQAIRASFLAYAFLRGKEYKDTEFQTWSEPNWAEVERVALKFGADRPGENEGVKKRLADWLVSAKIYFENEGMMGALSKKRQNLPQ